MNITTEPMKCRLRTGYKTKSFWASWDGDDKIEIYKELTEDTWIATIYLHTDKVDYYWTKTAPKPDVSRYKFVIPAINKEYTDIRRIKVNWT